MSDGTDLLDIQLLHTLQIDGRAPFSRIAEVIGVSDQTVARRYNRLRAAGLLRVRGLVEPSRVGMTQWILRIGCTPSAAATVAEALARRADTSWVSLTAGGTEIVCVVDAHPDVDHPAPLLAKLPVARGVLTIDAHCVLHEFFGGTMSLINKNGPLTPAQIAALRPAPAVIQSSVRALSASDDRLLRALRHDGRATVTSLAAATGWSPTTVRRRIAELVTSRLLYFDVDFNQALLDVQLRAVMWLRVPADQLAAVGAALAGHPEVGYVAATTGSTNLYCAISCPTAEAVYIYLTDRVGRLTSVQQLETAPVLRSVKTSSVLVAT